MRWTSRSCARTLADFCGAPRLDRRDGRGAPVRHAGGGRSPRRTTAVDARGAPTAGARRSGTIRASASARRSARSRRRARPRRANEQAASAATRPPIATALAEGNRAYEARFGHVFIVCATGKTRRRDAGDAARAADERSRHRAARSPPTSSDDHAAAAGEAARMTDFTHVLDTSLGRPAAALTVQLQRQSGGDVDGGVARRRPTPTAASPALLPAGGAARRRPLPPDVRRRRVLPRPRRRVVLRERHDRLRRRATPPRTTTCRCC